MCDLCSDNEEIRKQEINRLHAIGKDLANLSDYYYRLANGKIKPHTDECKKMGLIGRSLIKELIEWI